jgi:hypothetical protein
VISWQSQKQRVVALSSCEVEYIAPATASCQAVWLGRLLTEIKGSEIDSAIIRIDSMSAIQLRKNLVFHEQSKHIDTRYHFIRECIEEGKVEVESVGRNDQLADLLTKSLGRDRFVELRTRVGILNNQDVCKA